MASIWQKTLFYLGLVDEEQIEAVAQAEEPRPASQAAVRTVEPEAAPAQTYRSPEPPQDERTTVAPRTRGSVPGRRVEPPAQQRRRMSTNPVHAEAGVLVTDMHEGESSTARRRAAAQARAAGPSADVQSKVITATKFSDAQQLADHLRDGIPVVLDLRYTEPAMVRRLVDFSSGLTYALDGSMRKIGQGVILVSPQGVAMTVEELQRLSELGLYEARDLG